MVRWLIVPCALLLGCARKDPPAASKARPVLSPSAHASAPHGAGAGAPRVPTPPPSPTSVKVELETDGGLPGLVVGELFDVGPAGPATASSTGVVLLTRKDQLLEARMPPGTNPARTKLPAVTADAADLSPLGRGPGVAGGMAYWVSRGRLVRRGLGDERELEVLREDARESCRASTVDVDGTTLVGYLGKPDEEGASHARLWASKGPPLDLTPEGAGASSVALTALGNGRALAVSIDGRSAMTPLHARTIEVTAGSAKLGDDVVAWVGGPAHSFTEVIAGASAGVGWAAVPLERDATHFGLATLELGSKPRMDTEASFFDYLNGLDLAPAAVAELCGRAVLAFVRPTTRAPRSPAELVLAEPASGRMVRVASASGFASVSVSAAAGGGLVAYVADGRTWALGIGCH